ncbi:hypothetical protein Tco_0689088, partial [Tanacetum coccineum]
SAEASDHRSITSEDVRKMMPSPVNNKSGSVLEVMSHPDNGGNSGMQHNDQS